MTKNNFGYLSISELHNLYVKKEVSPVDVINETLDNIKEINKTLFAYVTITEEFAIKKAKEAEKKILNGEPLSLLTGIPIPIKDVEPMKDIRCTYGSLARDGIAKNDSMVVRKIKENDGIIVGKTNTPEYGMAGTSDNRVYGSTFNPWNKKMTSGGSSGGSAVSVSSGLTSVGQGGDGGGSIRIPASFCGVFGIKPTQGRISRLVDGSVKYNVVSNATSGPITRFVEDSAVLLNVLSGFSNKGEYITINEESLNINKLDDTKKFKIAYSPSVGNANVDNEVAKNVLNAINKYQNNYKSEINEINFYPESTEEIYNVFFDFFCVKGYASDPELLEDKEISKNITDYLKRNWEHGKTLSGSRIFECYNKIGYYRDYLNKLFLEYDFLITPTMATTAFEVNNPPKFINNKKVNDPLWDFTPLTYYFNLTGNPASNIPIGNSNENLPIGLQIIGKMGSEIDILNISKQFQNIFQWERFRPTISV